MVTLRNSVLLSAAALATSRASTTLAETAEEVQMIELAVYVEDIAANMAEYLSFRKENPSQPYPQILNTVVLEAAGSSDESWTTALTGIDPSTVWEMLTGVPWYSTRIYPSLTARLAAEDIVVSGINDNGATATPTAASTSATATGASVATNSARVSSTSSRKESSTASDKVSTSKASSTSKTSSVATIEQQTNAGAKAVAGLGFGALGAVALLI